MFLLGKNKIYIFSLHSIFHSTLNILHAKQYNYWPLPGNQYPPPVSTEIVTWRHWLRTTCRGHGCWWVSCCRVTQKICHPCMFLLDTPIGKEPKAPDNRQKQASGYRPSNLVNQTFVYCCRNHEKRNRSRHQCYYQLRISTNPRLSTGGALCLSRLMADTHHAIVLDDQFIISLKN